MFNVPYASKDINLFSIKLNLQEVICSRRNCIGVVIKELLLTWEVKHILFYVTFCG